jgi:hypothetical protein
MRQTPVTNEDLKILDIYGASTGHLFRLKQAEEKIRKLNEELEHRFVERTAQLQAVTYSAPHYLRAIDGYTSILLEDCKPRLDEEGKRVCTTICVEGMATSVYRELTRAESRGLMEFQAGKLPEAAGDATFSFTLEKSIDTLSVPDIRLLN